MFLRSIDHFRRWLGPRGFARLWPAILALVFFAPAPVFAENTQLPCNRIAKVLGSGTVADRNALAAAYPSAVSLVVAQCKTSLERGFASPVRPHLTKPSPQTWQNENAWLAAYLQTLPAEDAAAWIGLLDYKAVTGTTLRNLAVQWATDTTVATDTVFLLLRQIEAPTERTQTLFAIEPLLLALESNNVTTATNSRDAVRTLGYPALFSDPELTILWSLRKLPVSQEAAEAFYALGAGNEREAYRRFSQVMKNEPAYMLHTAALADRLFAKKALPPTDLLQLPIEYRRCDDIYRVQWGLGKMLGLMTGGIPRDFAAEAALRRAFKCGEVIDDSTDEDALKSEYTRWRKQFAGTHAEARYRLVSLEKMAAVADKLGTQGRLSQANELRAFIYQETLDERPFRYLGGVTHARELRQRVRGYLAFPPEPEVFVNDPLH